MAKALTLSDDTLQIVPEIPRAAKPAATPAAASRVKSAPIAKEPLQVRWPADKVKAIKMAAIDRDQTVSDFMLSCFHAFMQNPAK